MKEKEALLQEAFKAALQTKEVNANQTDNADSQIKSVMIDYILKEAVGLDSVEIDAFISGETAKQDVFLEASFEQAAEEVKEEVANTPLDEIRSHIEAEMQEYFREKQAEIRKKRIELYVDEQIKAQRDKTE